MAIKEKLQTPQIGETVRSTVIAPRTESTEHIQTEGYSVRIVKCKFYSWRYRTEVMALGESEEEDEVLDHVYTKTRPEANLCLAAMGKAVMSVLGHLGVYASQEYLDEHKEKEE